MDNKTEQPIVEFTEHADFESYLKFNRFSARRTPAAWFGWGIPPAVLALLCLFLVLRSGFVASIPALFICVVFLGVLLATIRHVPRSTYKRDPGRNAFVSVISFYDDKLCYVTTVQSNAQELTQNGTIGYDSVVKAYETGDAFYIKHSLKLQWSFFPKKYMMPEQADELRRLFARSFNEKFKGMKGHTL